MPYSVKKHIACQPHNHNDCVDTAMALARTTCLEAGLRLTPTREQVLFLIWQSHKPLGAYDIIAQLTAHKHEGERKVIAPPTVYRALEFLLTQGFIHRIASLNAFVGCSLHKAEHISQFLLCSQCGIAIEMDSQNINRAIQQKADSFGFAIQSETIEVIGLCSRCQPGLSEA